MKKYSKMQLIITSVAILIPVIVGLFLWNKLPDRVVTHWNGNGEPDGWSSKGFAVFGMPLILLAAHWVAIFFTTHDPRNKYQNRKILDMIILLMPIASLGFCDAAYAAALGYEININMIVCAFLGVLFILIGNYLPKCKQNYTIGIKVIWALDDEENWNRTHRLAGRVWTISGALILLTALIGQPMILFFIFAAMVLIPTVYSYLYYRKNRS